MKLFITFISAAYFLGACYWAHEDDILPTPVVSTPYTPNPGLINSLSQATRKVIVQVELRDPGNCFLPYSLNKLRFFLIKDNVVVHSRSPEKDRFDFIERLEDGKEYSARLVLNEEMHFQKKFKADQKDVTILISKPCKIRQ